LGSVSITGASDLDVSDIAGKTSGGSIRINAGTLTINGSLLDATNYGAGVGGQISLRGDTQITLSNGANVHALAAAAGRGADIVLTGGSISASGGALVDVKTASVNRSIPSGAAGGLTVNTGTLILSGGAIFGSDVQGSGTTGPV